MTLLTIFSANTNGCSSVHFHPSGLAYAALNVGLDRLDNYADRGHFPRINRPLLDLPGISIGSAGRSYSPPRPQDPDDPPPPRSRLRPRLNLRADPHQVYFELTLRF